MKHGINYVTYDAPATIYFYGSPYCDYADPIIAATYAMLAAESLGLGTCMIGGIHPFLQNGSNYVDIFYRWTPLSKRGVHLISFILCVCII